MTTDQDDTIDPLQAIREGDVEHTAYAFEALLQRLGRMRPEDLAGVASLMRQRGNFGGFAVDAMIDVITVL